MSTVEFASDGAAGSRLLPRLFLRFFGRGGRDRRRLAEIGALDLARLVGLEDVAFLHVVEALEEDAALETLLDLAHVVLEAPQAGDRRLVDHGSVTNDTHLRVAADEPARDVGAGDDAEPRGAEERTHLGLAERLLHTLRGEHADERLLDVLGELVDDAVGA